MCMVSDQAQPSWDLLFGVASAQEGHFTTRQAAEAGYSPQLIAKHLKAGRMARVRRGVYRLVHFPAGEHEDLVAVWLWTAQRGVFSHETALALHALSDVLPSRIHVTLPAAWKRRRFRVPKGVVLHHSVIDEHDRSWVGTVPVTGPRRTLEDCTEDHLAPDLLRQAIDQARARGLVTKTEIGEIEHLSDARRTG